MREFIWRVIAAIVSWPAVAAWLIRRAQRTPYTPIYGPDGTTVYMGRWWLFNPYPGAGDERKRWGDWLPSVRIHHICQPDRDRHHHDHPWNARTIVLRGWYDEVRGCSGMLRRQGDTARLLFGEYHRIAEVCPGGVWTMFWTWKYRGTWGFLVDGKKVLWREYLAARDGGK